MTKKLQDYFPMIRTRGEVKAEIAKSPYLQGIFAGWETEEQEEFLDFCTGMRGVKVLYDGFFKEILNPELTPERLEHMLSVFLGKKVKIVQILPNDNIRIADESTLLITDIVVELEDGSIANIEVQKIGYAFPGERCGCYSADLLLRQYKRARSKRKKDFTYKDIKTVYTIVFFEKSTIEFRACKTNYIHNGKVVFDTGLPLKIPQEYILIPLDIYKTNMQNNPIRTLKEAWLSFLTYDDPERIMEIVDTYPEFREMYEEIYNICRNIERVMDMFSKELSEIDRNTVRYMIEEQQEQIEEQQEQIEEQQEQIEEQQEQIEEQKEQLGEKDKMIGKQQEKLSEQKERIKQLEEMLAKMDGNLTE